VREVSIEDQAYNAENVTFGDDRLGVMFYLKVVEDAERTLAEGRRCFKEREYVRIMVPGDRSNVVDRPVQVTGVIPTDDRLRFSRHYERFKQQKEQAVHDGTPLSLWPLIPAALAEEMKFINIFTVEQLAELSDTHVGKIPNGQVLKRKAKEFIIALKDQAQVAKLQTALDERDNRIDTMEKAIAEQAARIEAMLKKLK
jgi:hypothetical protein